MHGFFLDDKKVNRIYNVDEFIVINKKIGIYTKKELIELSEKQLINNKEKNLFNKGGYFNDTKRRM